MALARVASTATQSLLTSKPMIVSATRCLFSSPSHRIRALPVRSPHPLTAQYAHYITAKLTPA